MIENIGSRSYAAHLKERQTKTGKNAGKVQKYIEFTVTDKNSGKGVTYRIFINSPYTPGSGKNKGLKSYPVVANAFRYSKDSGGDWIF